MRAEIINGKALAHQVATEVRLQLPTLPRRPGLGEFYSLAPRETKASLFAGLGGCPVRSAQALAIFSPSPSGNGLPLIE